MTRRLDQLLVEEGFFESRARARAAIDAGFVRVNGAPARKASQSIAEGACIEIEGDVHDHVSRGGVKLEAALKAFEIDPAGKTCLDLGASTGGFSDVLLKAGAKKIYAVDVGRGQLHKKIANDPRVINLEKTHAKELSPSLIPDPIELLVCDVSFISLKKALPPAFALTGPGSLLVALIKPQFEVGRDGIGKGGMVKDGLADLAVAEIVRWLSDEERWRVLGVVDSPIPGGEGAKEFLVGAVKY